MMNRDTVDIGNLRQCYGSALLLGPSAIETIRALTRPLVQAFDRLRACLPPTIWRLYDGRGTQVKGSPLALLLRRRPDYSRFTKGAGHSLKGNKKYSSTLIESDYSGTMWMKPKSRCIGMLLLVLFACSSLASPDLFVLCTGEGGSARVERFHIVQSACSAKPAHRCVHSAASPAEIHHSHVRCTDVGLSGHLGLVKEREKLPEVLCLWISASPLHSGDLNNADGLAAAGGEAPVFNLSNHPPGIDLESVVLLI